MNKSDLAKTIAKDFDIAKYKAEKIVGSVLDNITKALKKGETAVFTGFGHFSVKKRAARKGRNALSRHTCKNDL